MDIKSTLNSFVRQKILVIGDFILDNYVQGFMKRISPEAPIPVVDVHTSTSRLGGVANSAANLRALSAEVTFCTVLGADEAGVKGLALMEDLGMDTKGVFVTTRRRTQSKTRIVAERQAVVRYDEGDQCDLDKESENRVIAFIMSEFERCDALLIADYRKGMLTDGVIDCLVKLKRQQDRFIAVDSKRLEAFCGLAPELVKPNFEEVQALLNTNISKAQRLDLLHDQGKEIQEACKAKTIALTLDTDGALWFQDGHFVCHSPSSQLANPSVNGAGDTFISAALLALLSGAAIPLAGKLATAAAAVVMEKEHTAACSLDELGLYFQSAQKLLHGESAVHTLAKLRQAEKKIVFTNGCFDILHSGHIHFLKKAKSMGDILVVGLNSDESVRRVKGGMRPINKLKERIEVLSAIGCVDFIIPFGSEDDDTANDVITWVRPDLFVKGANHEDQLLPERAILNAMEIPISYLPLGNHESTSSVIRRINERFFDEGRNGQSHALPASKSGTA